MEFSKNTALVSLFDGHRDIRVVIDSVLEGRLGSVVTDHAASPSVARLRIGCYDIFGGLPSAPAARDWISTVPTPRELVFPDPDYGAWSDLAQKILGTRLRPCPMRTFDPARLDAGHLRGIVANLPDGFIFAALKYSVIILAVAPYSGRTSL